MSRVPVIDISALVASDAGARDLADVATQLDTACREFGFFSIVGHSVDPALLVNLDAAARTFFAFPEQEKAEIAMAHAGRAWRGWFPLGGELTSGVPDLKEGLYFGAELDDEHPLVRSETPLHGRNLFPNEPADLRDVVLAYMETMTSLGQLVLSGLALALGLDRMWFADSVTADPLTLFRIFRYPPAGTAANWGVAEHTDYGLLTILAQDDRGGLEVRTFDGWIDAEPIANSFICNLGDMLERLTGGRYRSTPHRVRNTTDGDRLSFPFFLDPSWDAVVERLPIVKRPDEGSAADRWDHANVHGFTGTYGDYILGRVAKVFPDLA